MHVIEREQLVPRPVGEVFAFFAQASNLERIERVFVDRQVRGPYRLWHHTHEFVPTGDGTLVRDRVRYAVPLDRFAHPFVRRDLERIFDFRRKAVRKALG